MTEKKKLAELRRRREEKHLVLSFFVGRRYLQEEGCRKCVSYIVQLYMCLIIPRYGLKKGVSIVYNARFAGHENFATGTEKDGGAQSPDGKQHLYFQQRPG